MSTSKNLGENFLILSRQHIEYTLGRHKNLKNLFPVLVQYLTQWNIPQNQPTLSNKTSQNSHLKLSICPPFFFFKPLSSSFAWFILGHFHPEWFPICLGSLSFCSFTLIPISKLQV